MASAGQQRALTLIELLVALAIVGVLAAVAYPSYRSSLLRGHRLEAIDSLLSVAAAEESFHFAHGRYTDAFMDDEATEALPLTDSSAGGRYQLNLSVSDEEGFIATATPRPGHGQEADWRCHEFSIRANGLRRATDDAGVDSTDSCWG